MTRHEISLFHAFGSLCDFLTKYFSVLLDNCLMRIFMFFCRYEISLWGFMLFCCVLIYVYPKSSPWNAFCCIIFLRDLVKRFHAFWPLWDVFVKYYAFAAQFSHEISWWDGMLFWGSLRALRMRFHNLVWPLCDILITLRTFWPPNFLLDGVVKGR
jgi:hypothetical protein